MANPVDAYVGKRIALRRKWLGLSVAEAAAAIATDLATFERYEAGAERVSAVRLRALCEAFDVRPTFFFCDESTPDAHAQVLAQLQCVRLRRNLQ
ncbi:transcriptional regulator with XRE-family HTH domain [Rhodoblastus acidophilus]|uniref:helix-turn-helix domain-containing protein n=1 Tax=Rhodoblastus acidophilus TaxID=1074 RepID=UPI0022253945|nr:helix-turn-helix domain-containing protein [Rhodoblastus acidophilus]MCW2317426.1 transcriptional regulator with XRE-family HTH domain [Rhodoblastus acidophilus]